MMEERSHARDHSTNPTVLQHNVTTRTRKTSRCLLLRHVEVRRALLHVDWKKQNHSQYPSPWTSVGCSESTFLTRGSARSSLQRTYLIEHVIADAVADPDSLHSRLYTLIYTTSGHHHLICLPRPSTSIFYTRSTSDDPKYMFQGSAAIFQYLVTTSGVSELPSNAQPMALLASRVVDRLGLSRPQGRQSQLGYAPGSWRDRSLESV